MSEGLEILSDFDGAMVGAIRIDGRVVSIDLLYDQPAKADWLERGYSLHFALGIKNSQPKKTVVRVRVNDGDRKSLERGDPIIFSTSDPESVYRRMEFTGSTDRNHQ